MTSDRDGLATLQLKVGGMSCSFCANSIERALDRVKGVVETHVSLAHEETLVRYRAGDGEVPARVQETLRALGFSIRDPRRVEAFEEQAREERRERRDLIMAATAAITLFLAMSAMWLDLWQMRDWHAWTAWAIATFVFCWNGRRIIHKAWGAARRGITNQHVLLSVGAIGAYIGGVLGAPVPFLDWYGFVGFPAVDFFGVVVFLTTYHLLSGYISYRVRTRASESVRRLLEMQPATARVVREDGEQEIPIDGVVVGDRVRIRPGERIPVDGRVLEGESVVDESLVTGEPIPADRSAGDEVIGGSINQAGTLLVEVTRTGEESFLQQVARHVEEARAMKPGIILLVDRVLRVYVPVVLLISLAALLFWGFAPDAWSEQPSWVRALYAAVTVLVMGYPCSLGMATPLALIRGGGMAAGRGILVRSGEAFQTLKDITHVVLDKTGTVTGGRPRLAAIEPLGEVSAERLLALAATAEMPSEHPLGRALVEAAEQRSLKLPQPEEFQAVIGAGVVARVDGGQVLVGTRRLLRERGVAVAPAEEILVRHEARGRTAVLVAREGRLLGVLVIADTIKADAAVAVAAMQADGLVTLLVTGDNERTARAVADEVGIDQVHAAVQPQEKAERVRQLQRQGARVMMVGDGINDAPALMQADVGAAIGAGTDIAIESSDIVLIGQRLGAVLDARRIGASSYRKTVQNLWLAFLFNGIGVPLATTGLVHPAWAMIAMALSVSAVLANSFGGRLLSPLPGDGQSPAPASDAPAEAQTESRFRVPGIHCGACVEIIETGLRLEPGIAWVRGDADHRTVLVGHSGALSPERIADLIRQLGYRVQPGGAEPV
ncbi:MAG TPA: heavy metal translocating P-type ATPase [Sedimenticola thiotaurini]|uniref:Heavy metal translocating P-type ATPase n=1 Tax=Sedimenticola thiotaurini TaxID=1543721 RepID=A0A831RQ41_9GAMM|nr:heavy metal translocating P-type ATPase [Sedimenticola thiotaurini]